MWARVLGMALLSGILLQAQTPEKSASAADSAIAPEFFYIASYDGNVWMIIDVQPVSASDSKVRFIQVYPVCGTFHVQEDDHVFEGVSVRQLAANADICQPDEKIVARIRPLRRKVRDTEPFWEYVQGIEAQCGTQKVIHHLPVSDLLHFETLEAKAPRIAALWTLGKDIQQRYTSTGEQLLIYFSPAWDEIRAQQRHLSQQAAIEIRNGHYDLALPEISPHWRFDEQTRLSQVIPDLEEATGPEQDFGVVENVEQLGLKESQKIPYPQMGRIAHIEGDVTLSVYVDEVSGSVLNVAVLSGHPILARSATDAISAWKFLPPYRGENPLHLVVHYKVHCPPTIETTTTKTTHKRSRRKNSKNHH